MGTDISMKEIASLIEATGQAEDREWGRQRERLCRIEANNLMELSVDVLKLRPRSRDCLSRANIETIRQLVDKNESELRTIPNFGRMSLRQIKGRMSDVGLCFNEHISC